MTKHRDAETGPTVTGPTVERTTDLDMDVDALWALISTAEGWRSWLVDETDVQVSEGSNGSATEAGVRREIHIDRVEDRRGVDFVWWDHDDPSSPSYVRLDIVTLPSGGSRLCVTERLVGATAQVSASVDIGWQVRFVSLWLLALHSTVMA